MDLINCTKCKEEKPVSEFYKNKRSKRGYQTHCKQCRSKDYKEKYGVGEYRERILKRNSAYAKIRTKDLKQWYYKLLLEKSCVLCGESHPAALQFNHINPKDKLANVSFLVGNKFSKETILKEINKCEVLCANCHAKKTAEDFNWYDYFDGED